MYTLSNSQWFTYSTTAVTYSFWCNHTYHILLVSFFAIRTIALCLDIRLIKVLYAAVKAGSLRTPTHAASIMILLRNLFCLFDIPHVISFVPLECVEGTKPIKPHRWSRLRNLWISTSSVYNAKAVISPIPEIVCNSLIVGASFEIYLISLKRSSSFFLMCFNSLICSSSMKRSVSTLNAISSSIVMKLPDQCFTSQFSGS